MANDCRRPARRECRLTRGRGTGSVSVVVIVAGSLEVLKACILLGVADVACRGTSSSLRRTRGVADRPT